jgi:hypothetical protein
MSPHILGGERDPVFPWVRYWTPSNKSIQLGASSFWGGDSDGFLADPEDKLLGAENRHLLSTEHLLEPRPGCFILCGEPGMGKSRALDAALKTSADPHRIFLEFRDIATWEQFYRQTFETGTWRNWREGTHLLSLVIDGVDEGLIKIDGFVGALAGALKLNTEPLARLQLALACRSWEWPKSEGERLLALWPDAVRKETEDQTQVVSGLYELCPLRDRDARLAADASLVGLAKTKKTGADFMRELRRHRLIALGSRPLTLKMLLREFAEGAGAFPRSHRELYRRCTRTLISEHDEGRRSSLRNKPLPRLTASENKRLRVAQRIAALMLLCGRSAIAHSSVRETDASDLTFAEIQHGEERIGDIPFEVDEAIIESVLETPLFWPKTAGRAVFYHRTFAEHLAAGYLSSLPFPQQRSLLFQRDEHGEHVHPQLGELAAWLAGESDLLLRHLLAHDPEVLLRSDVSDVRDEQKAALVAAILAKARAEELFDGAGVSRFFHTLKHPGLARQLRETLHDRSANQVARRLCFSIAEACRLEEMLPDAIRCLCSPEDCDLYHVAAGALDDLATPQTAHRLIPFLRKGCTHRECLMILHTLLKHGVWSVSRALPHVPRALPPDSHSGGILAQHATAADADALLRTCLIWPGCFDTLSRFHPFVREAYRHGIARMNEPRIRLLLTRVWWRARRRHQDGGFVRGDRDDDDRTPHLPDLLKADARMRHRFIADWVSVARIAPGERIWLIRELLHAGDLPELIERACIGSKRRRRIYAQLAAACYFTDNAVNSSLLIEALPRSVELRDAFPWMRLWQIGAPDSVEAAKQHREWLTDREDMERRRKAWAKPTPAPETVWRRDLKLLDPKSPSTHWLTLADRLSYQGPMTRDADETRHDITTTPGWKFHDAATQDRIKAGARRLILEVPGNPHHQIGAGQSEFDELTYKALFLLRREIETEPALAQAVRRHWLPTIFDEFSNADAHHSEMMALAYRLDAERMRGFLREKILRSANQGEGHCFALREFAACWDARLAAFVVSIFAREVRSPDAIRHAMEHLAEHDQTAAILLWRRLRARHRRKSEWPAFSAATSALAGSRLFEFWEELWPALIHDSGLARHVFLTMDRMDQREFIKNIENVPPRRLGELYLRLLDLFPKREDPPIPFGRTYSPTRRMDMARMRDEFPALLGSIGSAEAVEELERIACSVPASDAVWIRWRKQAALVALRRGSWRPPAAEEVLALVEKAEHRWIQDEDDLMALVIESLGRLQTNLRASPNSLRDRFWTRTGKAQKGSRLSLSPEDEVSMSRVIAQWLEVDLDKSKGLSVLRELQIQHNNRTDIEVSAVALGANARTQRAIQVVIEVKGHWHPKIKTAHRDQLVRDYLQGCGRTHGIYLVVWTLSDSDSRRCPLKAKTPEDAQHELDALILPYDGRQGSESLRAVVLDARIP